MPDVRDEPGFPEDAVEVGRILGAWGIKGGFKVAPFAADPQGLLAAKRWFLKPAENARPALKAAAAVGAPAGRKTPAQLAALARPLPATLDVRGVRDQGDAIVALAPDEVPDRDAAEALKGARVFVSRSVFPPADDDEFYWIDLIGCAVANRDGVALGEVVGLIDTGPHCVLRLQPTAAEGPDAEERLIPFVDAYVDTVDLPARRIVVDWGLDF